MKKRKFLLLPLLLLISAIVVGSAGAYLKYQVLKPLGLCQDQSVFAVPFIMLTDEGVQYSLHNAKKEEQAPVIPETAPETETTVPVTTLAPTESAAEPATEPNTEPAAEPTAEPTIAVLDESWFDDALFIGDSRTQGLMSYGQLGKADFFCDAGMNVFATKDDSLTYMLEHGEYGKIYINLGINEITGPRDPFLERYQELIDKVRRLQPDAVIILQAQMTVGRGKAESDQNYSLENIQKLNEDIASLADGEMIRFIDVNEWIADEEGYLPDEVSQDGVHLYGPDYTAWSQWLLENASTLGIN